VYETWMACGCNGAEAARRLKCSRQTVYRTLRRHLDGLDIAREARVEEEERLARRRGRQAYRARCRRRERESATTLADEPETRRLPLKAHPQPGEGGSSIPPRLTEILHNERFF
jgi:hypothetical protein